jgi:hypothetical protein
VNIFDKVIEVLSKQHKSVFTTAEIKTLCHNIYGLNKTSVIPSDYCYNRTNNGINTNKNILIYLGSGEYKYVGKSYNYEGWVFHREKSTKEDKIVGQWKSGVYITFDTSLNIVSETIPKGNTRFEVTQLEKLYGDYLNLFEVELNLLRCSPTELRHLIGRIGEFKCALLTNGQLSSKPNQQGFDVISATGQRISVKTTAQKSGFVSINANTVDLVDEIMVIQFNNNCFSVIHHGPIKAALEVSRMYNNKYELDISKVKKLNRNVA